MFGFFPNQQHYYEINSCSALKDEKCINSNYNNQIEQDNTFCIDPIDIFNESNLEFDSQAMQKILQLFVPMHNDIITETNTQIESEILFPSYDDLQLLKEALEDQSTGFESLVEDLDTDISSQQIPDVEIALEEKSCRISNNMDSKLRFRKPTQCKADGCLKQTFSEDFCISHGGRRMCKVKDCVRVDRGRGLCGAHGGGKKCRYVVNDGPCDKAARKQGYCCAHYRKVFLE